MKLLSKKKFFWKKKYSKVDSDKKKKKYFEIKCQISGSINFQVDQNLVLKA